MKYSIVLLVLFIVTGICLPAWDYAPPRPAKDMSGSIVIVPVSVYKEYGFSLETTVFYNIERILLALQTQQILIVAQGDRIKVLEEQVQKMEKELEKPVEVEVADPNEVLLESRVKMLEVIEQKKVANINERLKVIDNTLVNPNKVPEPEKGIIQDPNALGKIENEK